MTTIRAILGRRTRNYLLVAIVGWLVFIAAVLIPAIAPIIMIGAFVAVVGAMLGLILGIRCPRCGARLLQLGLAEVWAPLHAQRIAHCPRCQLDVNDESNRR
ncbi:MAG: hypothetical protein HYX63_02715 [Gammaproteobacteria bacterium]|nr:hypothetical protein [Gammaproteobacteria bacterium]